MSRPEPHAELPAFVHWFDLVEWLLGVTEKMPKSVRLSMTWRVEALALDVLEGVVEARYARSKGEILRRLSLQLERLRILLRLCHRRRLVATSSYEHAARGIDEMGRMLGGWLKQQEVRP